MGWRCGGAGGAECDPQSFTSTQRAGRRQAVGMLVHSVVLTLAFIHGAPHDCGLVRMILYTPG